MTSALQGKGVFQQSNTIDDESMNPQPQGGCAALSVSKVDTAARATPWAECAAQIFGALRGMELSTVLPSWFWVR